MTSSQKAKTPASSLARVSWLASQNCSVQFKMPQVFSFGRQMSPEQHSALSTHEMPKLEQVWVLVSQTLVCGLHRPEQQSPSKVQVWPS